VRFIISLLISSLLVASHAGAGPRETKSTGEPVEILIAAAASLSLYCQSMGREFEAQSPRVRVLFAYASSGHLRQQIEAGAPVDGFISASARQMDLLESKGFIRSSSRLTLAHNRLVLIVPARESSSIKAFSDLTDPPVTALALGDPSHVPAGYYGRAALESLGLWKKVQPKLIYGLNVRQVLQYVMQGEVDAGLVYSSDAQSSKNGVRTIAVAPEGTYPQITYPMAVLREAAHPDEAEAFFTFLRSPRGQSDLLQYGLQPVLSEISR
jgi:molybdate transport system substrate-binding protein